MYFVFHFIFLICRWGYGCDAMTVAFSHWAVCLYQHWLYSSWEKTFQVILIREWNLDPFLGAINRREFSGMRHICASEYLNVFVVFECVESYHCVALQMPVLIKTNIICCAVSESLGPCGGLLLVQSPHFIWDSSLHIFHLSLEDCSTCSHQRSEELSLIE